MCRNVYVSVLYLYMLNYISIPIMSNIMVAFCSVDVCHSVTDSRNDGKNGILREFPARDKI